MSTKNDITGDKIQSKPSTKAWYEASYWTVLDDKLKEKERESRDTLASEMQKPLDDIGQ
jgi:hypothetical protein